MMKWAATRLGLGLILALSTTIGKATPPPTLSSLWAAGEFSTLFGRWHEFQSSQDQRLIRQWSDDNQAPAMWLQAMGWYQQGDLQQAANWMYTALLTTRMDAALCINSSAAGIDGRMARQFLPAVTAVRQDPKRVTEAIRFAVAWQADRRNQANDPGWTCREMAKDGHRTDALMRQVNWAQRREHVFQAFRRTAGLGDKPCMGAACAGLPSGITADPSALLEPQ